MAALEVKECPFCIRELTASEYDWYPCPCGYQVCAFCFDRWNERCAHCNREYDKDAMSRVGPQYKPVNNIIKIDTFYLSRRLVQITGLPRAITSRNPDQLLIHPKYLGQYGKIESIFYYRANEAPFTQTNLLRPDKPVVIVQFSHRQEAELCIMSLNGFVLDDSVISAGFLLNEKCRSYLENHPCRNHKCVKKHEEAPTDEIVFTLAEIEKKNDKLTRAMTVSVPPDYKSYPRRSTALAVFPPPRLIPTRPNPFLIKKTYDSHNNYGNMFYKGTERLTLPPEPPKPVAPLKSLSEMFQLLSVNQTNYYYRH